MVDSQSDAYLARALERQRRAAMKAFPGEVDGMMRRASSRGSLHSGSFYIELHDMHVAKFNDVGTKMVQTAFDANLDKDADAETLEKCLKAYRDELSEHLVEVFRGQRANEEAAQFEGLRFVKDVNDMLTGFVDDFLHDMLNGKRMTKDDSIVGVMMNSPGAVQQVGHRNRQTAIHADHMEVQSALADFLRSPEVESLPIEKQQALRDVADVVGELVTAAAPDQGKLKRWGGRLLELARDLGVEVAAAGISKALFG